MRVLFALVAWGNDYVRDFLDVSLPSLIAEGNLAHPEVQEGSRLLILTGRSDIPTFKADPILQALGRSLAIEYVDISRFRTRDKYGRASRCQQEALRRSEDFDAVFLLYPDMIWCRGGVRYALQRLSEGALALLSPAPAVLPSETLGELRGATTGVGASRTCSVSARRLAGIALRHHHPMWDAFDWDGDCFSNSPSCLRWNIAGGNAWLIRCYHLHPVALRVQRDNPRFIARFTTSLDGEYVPRLFDGTDDLDFATDTDSFAMVTLRDRRMPPLPVQGKRSSVTTVARWAEANAFLLHRLLVDVAFRWHEEPISEEVWRQAELRSQTVVTQVRERLHTPDSIIRIEDPQAYSARRRRSRSIGFGDALNIDLPPSHARVPRAQLALALVKRTAFGAILASKGVLEYGPIAGWLRQRPAAIALWRRIKGSFTQDSPIYAAASTTSLIRNILNRGGEGGSVRRQ